MSTAGSYYGWIYPEPFSKEEAFADLTRVFEAIGLRFVAESDNRRFDFEDSKGFRRTFHFYESFPKEEEKGIAVRIWHPRVQFRPLDLSTYPSDYEITQQEYDFTKLVFDRSQATECFGLYALQDNAVSFADSNLNFFFLKTGPQLILQHLEERRLLEPEENDFHSSSQPEFERTKGWDDELHSEYFTRFKPEPEHRYRRVIRTYDLMNDLVRLSWDEFYRE